MTEANGGLTQAGARQRIGQYLARTVGAMPGAAGITFTRSHPERAGSIFSGGRVTPCHDEETTTCVILAVNYWAIARPARDTAQLAADIASVWAGWHWPAISYSIGTTQTTRAVSPDGYQLAVHDNAGGAVWLSAESPGFPGTTVDQLPMPREISALSR